MKHVSIFILLIGWSVGQQALAQNTASDATSPKKKQALFCDTFQEAKDHVYMGALELPLPQLKKEGDALELTLDFKELLGRSPSPDYVFLVRLRMVKEGIGLSQFTVWDKTNGHKSTAWVPEANSIVTPVKQLNARLEKSNKYAGFQGGCSIREARN